MERIWSLGAAEHYYHYYYYYYYYYSPKKQFQKEKNLSLYFSAGRNPVAIGLHLSLSSSSSSSVSQNIWCHSVFRCQKEAKLVLLSLSRTDRGRGGEEFFRKCMRQSVKSLSGQISRRKIVLSSSSSSSGIDSKGWVRDGGWEGKEKKQGHILTKNRLVYVCSSVWKDNDKLCL